MDSHDVQNSFYPMCWRTDSLQDQHSFMTTYSAPFGAKRSTMWGQRSPTNGYLNSASQDAPDKDWRDDQSFFSISLYMDSQSPPSGRFAPNSARSSHFPPLPVRPGHTSARSSRFPPVFLAI
ncbi:hypothetical protein DXG01_010397 [Tephrocybe rancida]|nr:hypothetical protein DXG01_010397 [Tephrocybe rancida]